MSLDGHVLVDILEEIPFLNEGVCNLYLPAGLASVRNSEVSARREYSELITYSLIGFQNMTSVVK